MANLLNSIKLLNDTITNSTIEKVLFWQFADKLPIKIDY